MTLCSTSNQKNGCRNWKLRVKAAGMSPFRSRYELVLGVLGTLVAIVHGDSVLLCDRDGMQLDSGGGGSGAIRGNIGVAAVTNELVSVSTCLFRVGRLGYQTSLTNLVADGDPSSSYAIIYGETSETGPSSNPGSVPTSASKCSSTRAAVSLADGAPESGNVLLRLHG